MIKSKIILPLLGGLVIYFMTAPDHHNHHSHNVNKPGQLEPLIQKWGYVPYYALPEKKTDSWFDTFKNYDTIAVTGYTLNSKGDLVIRPQAKKFHSIATRINSLEYVPVITPTDTRSAVKLLESHASRATAAKQLKAFVTENNVKHLHLDFEYLPARFVQQYSQLIKQLKQNSPGSKVPSIKISAALFAQVDYQPSVSAFHDLKVLSEHLDEVVFMGYDYHRTHKAPGPVTDIEWVEKNLAYFIEFFASDKIWLGIPLYGYRFYQNKTTVLKSSNAMKFSKSNKVTRDSSHCLKIQFKDSTGYLSDKHTQEILAQTALLYSLKGIALWRLGF